MKRILKGTFFIVFLSTLLLLNSACGQVDAEGKWKLTLKWDERAVYEGEPPPANIFCIHLKDGKVYEDNKEVGTYKIKARIRLKIKGLKIICYGAFTDENHMSGETSYYPANEIYGTWTAERLSGN